MKLNNFDEFLNEGREPLTNMGAIHSGYAADRLGKWQKENKDTTIDVGDNVKMAFKDGAETEHMWVEIKEVVDKDNFKGILNNDPIAVHNIKNGDEVAVKRTDISQLLK